MADSDVNSLSKTTQQLKKNSEMIKNITALRLMTKQGVDSAVAYIQSKKLANLAKKAAQEAGKLASKKNKINNQKIKKGGRKTKKYKYNKRKMRYRTFRR
tara:strand:- start:298 stop:597 length:300 start_codon:yes stop_codon:yes gene_type:complete